MKIIHFTHELPQASGVATFVREVSAALEDIGVESRIVLDPKELPREPEAGTILHIHGMWKPVYHQAAKWAKANGVKIVWSTHGMTAPWSMAHKRWKKLIAWWLYQKRDLQGAALIHSTVEQEAEWNRALGLVEKVKVKGVGEQWIRSIIVPLGTYLPEEKSESTAVHLCSSPSPTPKTLLFIGRIYPVKALDRLIEAFSRAHVPGWQLRLVGPDQSGHTAELKSLCEKLSISYSDATNSTDADCAVGSRSETGVGTSHQSKSACREATCVPKIIFAGPKFGPDLAAEYAACDILALVSHTENFGATVVDALAHGKPVITSTNTPWREVVGACGWWVDNDVDTLTACLRSALTTPPSTLAQMGARGRSLVESKYTWRAVASRLSTAYAEIVGCR